jgi:hypothetical protein
VGKVTLTPHKGKGGVGPVCDPAAVPPSALRVFGEYAWMEVERLIEVYIELYAAKTERFAC